MVSGENHKIILLDVDSAFKCTHINQDNPIGGWLDFLGNIPCMAVAEKLRPNLCVSFEDSKTDIFTFFLQNTVLFEEMVILCLMFCSQKPKFHELLQCSALINLCRTVMTKALDLIINT